MSINTDTLFLLNAAQRLIVSFQRQLYSECLQQKPFTSAWHVLAGPCTSRLMALFCVSSVSVAATGPVCGLVAPLHAWRYSWASLVVSANATSAELMPRTLGRSRQEEATVIKPIIPEVLWSLLVKWVRQNHVGRRIKSWGRRRENQNCMSLACPLLAGMVCFHGDGTTLIRD